MTSKTYTEARLRDWKKRFENMTPEQRVEHEERYQRFSRAGVEGRQKKKIEKEKQNDDTHNN